MARFYTQVPRRMRDATLVTTPGQLEAAVFRLQGATRLAVDTEFMRERTYRAQLCLVQVASDADCYLVDPLAGLDLAPLFAALGDRGRVKILHAARQDLEVLLQVQLRAENREKTMYNLVGFQTKMTWSEQRRVLRMIPGLEKAEFVRLGVMHRNTFINAPDLLLATQQLKSDRRILFAGQITGVEGYVESAASGLLAGINVAALASGREPYAPPQETALGALVHHITNADVRHFQPMNINYGLFPALEGRVKKKERKLLLAERALVVLDGWKERRA